MINLLIADDNYDFIKMIFNELVNKNIENISIVNISSNGKEALDYILNKNIDIVLLDLQMPILNRNRNIKNIKRKE